MDEHSQLVADDVSAGLRRLGVAAGDTVFCHASLKAFGRVNGGAATVVQALLEVIGPQGTLVVPTFSDFFWGGETQVWDREQTPSRMGAISEAVRGWPGARRSSHAPHSVAAIGPQAARYARHDRGSDFGPHSAFQQLLADDAWIILLGVDFNVCTVIHVVEERLAVPYRRWRELKGNVVIAGVSAARTFPAYLRKPGVENDFLKCGRDLVAAGLVDQTTIGAATVKAIRATALVAAVEARVVQDPFYLVSAATRAEAMRP